MAPAARERRGRGQKPPEAGPPRADAAGGAGGASTPWRSGLGLVVLAGWALGLDIWAAVHRTASTFWSPPPRPGVWAAAAAPLAAPLQAGVGCAPDAAAGRPLHGGRCARYVADDAVPAEAARELRGMVEWLLAEIWGGGAGPPSVVDLHAGSISYKESFVELAAFMDWKKLEFTRAQVAAFTAVREALRTSLAKLLGVAPDSLLHDLSFISHINASKTAKTVHDEYWHSHVDTLQYGTFAYTALLYLSTEGVDFDGGTFVFEGTEAEPNATLVEPRFGRLVAFTSSSENPHRVEQVTRGIRITLTVGFTCDRERAASIEPWPRAGRAGGRSGLGAQGAEAEDAQAAAAAVAEGASGPASG